MFDVAEYERVLDALAILRAEKEGKSQLSAAEREKLQEIVDTYQKKGLSQ